MPAAALEWARSKVNDKFPVVHMGVAVVPAFPLTDGALTEPAAVVEGLEADVVEELELELELEGELEVALALVVVDPLEVLVLLATLLPQLAKTSPALASRASR